jgi:hypothetical protein
MSAPTLVVWVEALCPECPWTSGEGRSQGEALAAYAAHQRLAHPQSWGAGR